MVCEIEIWDRCLDSFPICKETPKIGHCQQRTHNKMYLSNFYISFVTTTTTNGKMCVEL